ncbi:MAG: SRPBCC domain-containing protein [Emcibacteraceae bacterium]|nr:SRPBCC domain-containing protein [Emcibacteraceae bacterium]
MDMIDTPVAKAEILIRKPINQVFNAFTDPDQITQFWFDKSSGPLFDGATVEWAWSELGMTIPVTVKKFIKNEKIIMNWGADEHLSELVWTFTDRASEGTYVSLVNLGFFGTNEETIVKALDSTGGFNLVIAAAKAYLEHGIRLNIVADKL